MWSGHGRSDRTVGYAYAVRSVSPCEPPRKRRKQQKQHLDDIEEAIVSSLKSISNESPPDAELHFGNHIAKKMIMIIIIIITEKPFTSK